MLFAKPNDDASININAECILRNLQNIIAPSIAAHHIENGNHGDRLKIDQPRRADPTSSIVSLIAASRGDSSPSPPPATPCQTDRSARFNTRYSGPLASSLRRKTITWNGTRLIRLSFSNQDYSSKRPTRDSTTAYFTQPGRQIASSEARKPQRSIAILEARGSHAC